nr:hypothetical protein Q903MT_gene633 [Picea sitchensis]
MPLNRDQSIGRQLAHQFMRQDKGSACPVAHQFMRQEMTLLSELWVFHARRFQRT